MRLVDTATPPATILVVEDSPQLRELFTEVLCRSGYQVLTAENAQHALQTIAEQAPNLGLAILDLQMPITDGQTLAELLWQSTPHLPVILTSGCGPDRLRPFTGDGKVCFLQKPYRITTLRTLVDELLPRAS